MYDQLFYLLIPWYNRQITDPNNETWEGYEMRMVDNRKNVGRFNSGWFCLGLSNPESLLIGNYA